MVKINFDRWGDLQHFGLAQLRALFRTGHHPTINGAFERGFCAKNKPLALTVYIVHTYIKIVLFAKE